MATKYVVSSGCLSLLELYSGDTLDVYSGGSVHATSVCEGGTARISGGAAIYTSVFNGRLYLYGGLANGIIISSGGSFHMTGGYASQVILNRYTSMTMSGGSAEGISVDTSKSYLDVKEGIINKLYIGHTGSDNKLSAAVRVSNGNITSAFIRGGGTMTMYEGVAHVTSVFSGGTMAMSGGRASSVEMYGGRMMIFNASANGVSATNGGTVQVLNGGKLSNGYAGPEGTIRVAAGGSASAVSVEWGTLEVSGHAENVRGEASGTVNVRSGGTVTGITCSSPMGGHNGAVLNVMLGGVVSSGLIAEEANVLFGGQVSGLTMISAGVLNLSGGTATATNVMVSAHLNVSAGLAKDTVLCPITSYTTESNYNTPAYMDILTYGSASNTVVSAHGSMEVHGGTAIDTTVLSGGIVTVVGGALYNHSIEYGGDTTLWSGGFASGGTITGGRLDVDAGCAADGMTVVGGNGSFKGMLVLQSGGLAQNTSVGPQGSLYVGSNAGATATVVSHGGVTVIDGGSISGTEIDVRGALTVASGGTAGGTIVHSQGFLFVSDGGKLSSATVEDGGICRVSSGGAVEHLTVESGGTAVLSSGSIITGPLTLNGGTVTFDLASLAEPGGTPLVTNFDKIAGTPTGAPNYQLAVNSAQTPGAYLLADKAAGFDGSIKVTNDTRGDVGFICAGRTLKFNDQYYTLSLDGNDLSMTVSAPSDTLLTLAGEFAVNYSGDELVMFTDGSILLHSLCNEAGETAGNLDPNQWKLLWSLDFDGDGLDELAFKETVTGNVFLADDPASGISENKLATGVCLGLLGQGYSFYGGGSFDGKSGQNDVLMKGPAFGDPTLSLNYGLPVWVFDNGVKQYDGWLGALVNTWQAGDPLRGDTSDLASINANNYQYDLVGIGDFNGDGRSDVMLQNTMASSVYGKTITGAGDIFVFLTGDENAVRAGAAPTVCYTGKVDPVDLGGWCVAGIGDFNNDNIDDVLLLDQTTGDVACWIMNNGQMQAASGIGTLSANQEIAGIWDVDGDGTDDVVLADATMHTAWLIQDAQRIGTQYLA